MAKTELINKPFQDLKPIRVRLSFIGGDQEVFCFVGRPAAQDFQVRCERRKDIAKAELFTHEEWTAMMNRPSVGKAEWKGI